MAEQHEFPPIGMAFMRAVELAEALGVSKINQLDGCWTHAVDDHWWIAMNGHSDDQPASSPAGMSADVPCTVPPFSMYVERRGMAAAIVDPFGGSMIGPEDTEDALIAALDTAISLAESEGQ